MSYDIFCYKSKSSQPDEEEADAVIEADTNKWAQKEKNTSVKLELVKALTQFNPRLEAFDFDYGEIAKLTETTIEEAKKKFDHIEINSPDGDIAVQLIIYDHHVHISVPYWYKGEDARNLFQLLKSYIKIIRDTAGYFIWDPQTGEVYDPAVNGFEGLKKYLSVSEHLEEIVGSNKPIPVQAKPWWKFW